MDEAAIVAALAARDRDRLRGYREALAFYEGDQWSEARGRDRRLVLNYARVLIEKVTSYLLTDRAFVVDAENEADLDRARLAEAALLRVVEENDLEMLDFATEIDAAILGDGAYKVIWDDGVRVVAPDVQGLFVWTRPDGRVERVASRYVVDGESGAPTPPLSGTAARPTRGGGLRAESGRDARPTRDESGRRASHEAIARPTKTGTTRTGRATSETHVEIWTEATFSLWIDEVLARRSANPYGVIPFVVFPNLAQPKRFWGVSDLASIVAPAREINRAFSQLARILEISGNPIAVLENVDGAENIAIAPGAVWEVPERARAYLLDLLAGGGVSLHIDYIGALYRALHDLAETPRTAFGDNSRSLAGVALEIELQPLIQKVLRKRLIRTPAYRRRNALILRLLDQFTGTSFAPHRSRVIWGPVLPRDASRQLSDEQLAVTSGLRSRRSAMSRLGTADPDGELDRWLEEERRLARQA